MPLLLSVTIADNWGSCRRAATATNLGLDCMTGTRGQDEESEGGEVSGEAAEMNTGLYRGHEMMLQPLGKGAPVHPRPVEGVHIGTAGNEPAGMSLQVGWVQQLLVWCHRPLQRSPRTA
jgi:hypothetical protein